MNNPKDHQDSKELDGEIVYQVCQLWHPNGSIAQVQVRFNGSEVKTDHSITAPAPPKPSKRTYEFKQLCPFCGHQLDEELYNSVYGCETGCEYVRIKIECPNCHKIAWDSGTFGEFDNKDEKAEYRAEFMEKFAEELLRIAPDRLTQLDNFSKEKDDDSRTDV